MATHKDTEQSKISKRLDLRNQGLNKLKKKLIAKSLEVLDISENELSELKKVTKADSLLELYASNNNIIQIPDSISKLSLLKILDLSGNNLSQLPASLSSCGELETLKLSNCSFSSVPEVVSELKKLIYLDLSGNEELGKGKDSEFKPLNELGLETLKLSNCKLKSLPTVINSLKSLIELDISFNSLSKLSSGIQKLSVLEYINLSNNKFDSIPHILAKIKTLRKISINENPIKYLNDYIPEFQALEELDLTWDNLHIKDCVVYKDDISALKDYILRVYQKKDEYNIDMNDNIKFNALCRFCLALGDNKDSIMRRDFYKLFGFRHVNESEMNFIKRVFNIFDKQSIEFEDYVQMIEKLKDCSIEDKAKYIMMIFDHKNEITRESFISTVTEYLFCFHFYIFALNLYRTKVGSNSKMDENLMLEYHEDLETMKEHILDDAQLLSEKYSRVFPKVCNSSQVIDLKHLIEFMKSNEESIFDDIMKNIAIGLSDGVKDIPLLLLIKIDNHVKDKSFEKVRALIERYISKYGETSHILLKKAEYSINTENYKEAIKCCKKILKIGLETDLPQCWRIYGNSYEKEENYDKAIEAYNKSLSYEPKLVDTWASKGWLEYKREKYQQAYESALKALDIEYNHAEAVALKYLSSRMLKMPRKEVESTGYLAKKLNPDNELVSNLIKVPYSKKETKKSIDKKLKELIKEEEELDKIEKEFQEKRKSINNKY